MGFRWSFIQFAMFTLGLMGPTVKGVEVHGAGGEIDFARDIRPLLADRCFACHGPDRAGQDNDLQLDSFEAAVDHAIVPGDPDASPLMHRITAEDETMRMPPPESNRSPLTTPQVALLRKWIAEGGRFTQHWSYIPPRRPPVPNVQQQDWPRNAVDRFILAANERRGAKPAPRADRRTLARRLTFDLLGLPPNVADVQDLVDDTQPGAYGRFVDRVLESKHFGERMAVLWLDLVRFADTCGYHGDQHRDIDLYRDYVIEAFNSNKPFDQFTIEQLAGDLLAAPTTDQLIASGYNRLLQTTREGGAQAKEYRAIYAADRVRNVSSVWLGITLGCAQCHDHKFDPLTTADFYRFAAFFADIDEVAVGEQKPNLALPTDEQRRQMAQLDRQIADLKEEIATHQPTEDNQSKSQTLVDLEKKLKQVESKRGDVSSRIRRTLVTTTVEPRVTRILPRGNWLDETGDEVQPAIPAQFGSLSADTRLTRMDLARWIVSEQNPLTARVVVNHLWRMMFGEGLVSTADDFGAQGIYPVHADLLDWLAMEFRDSGWNVKYLLRLLAMSNTYQQSSLPNASQDDPYNEYYARQNRFRLDAEAVRDNVLAISGLLTRDIGGRSTKPYQPVGYWGQLNFPKRTYQADVGASLYRRGVYTYWCRTFLHPSLMAFDAPTREECTAKRARSNTPLQALVLLNDPIYVEAAQAFGRRIAETPADSADQRVQWAVMQCLARPPGSDENEVFLAHYRQMRADLEQDMGRAREMLRGFHDVENVPDHEIVEWAAWTSVARVLLNLHETMTRY